VLRLFDFLGFRKFRIAKKRRRIYRLENAMICVDSVEGLGETFRIAGMLGYSRDESIHLSYLELLEKV